MNLTDQCLEIMGCETDCLTREDETVRMERVIALVRGPNYGGGGSAGARYIYTHAG